MSCPVTSQIEAYLTREAEQDAEAMEADPLEGYEADAMTLEAWEDREQAHEITVLEIV